jgi:hypothetical protein
MSIAVILGISIPIGIAALITFLSQLGVYCVLGTLIEIQNDKLLQKVNEFPFYELRNQKQKIFLQFIHAVQVTTNLELPLIGSTNMELFKDVVSAGYSFLGFVSNFVEF